MLWKCCGHIISGSFYHTPSKNREVRYPPMSEPLIYYHFDLDRWCNFKGFWLPVKQVLYKNKKLKHSSRFSTFSPFSRLLLYLCTSFAYCSVCLSKQNPQIRQLIPHLRRTHNLKLETLLLIQSNSSMPLASLFSSNPYSNQRRTHIQSNSAVLLLFHSKSATPPTIFRFSLYVWLSQIWVYIISLNFVGLWYYCFVWVSILIYLTN